MVLVKIAIVFAAIAGLLAAAQSQQWFERSGLLSRCTEVAAPYGNKLPGGQWWSCTDGAASGYKSLVRDSCDSKGFYGRTQLWYCPAPISQP